MVLHHHLCHSLEHCPSSLERHIFVSSVLSFPFTKLSFTQLLLSFALSPAPSLLQWTVTLCVILDFATTHNNVRITMQHKIWYVLHHKTQYGTYDTRHQITKHGTKQDSEYYNEVNNTAFTKDITSLYAGSRFI